MAGEDHPQAWPWLSPRRSASRPAKKVAAPVQSKPFSMRCGGSGITYRALKKKAAAPTGRLM